MLIHPLHRINEVDSTLCSLKSTWPIHKIFALNPKYSFEADLLSLDPLPDLLQRSFITIHQNPHTVDFSG